MACFQGVCGIKYRELYFNKWSAILRREIFGDFWNIKSGIYIKYPQRNHAGIYLYLSLRNYSSVELGWNTTHFDQSPLKHFLACIIRTVMDKASEFCSFHSMKFWLWTIWRLLFLLMVWRVLILSVFQMREPKNLTTFLIQNCLKR